jgi:hypothetical protein
MTFLIENETAALIVPASFLARIHHHFREVLQLLAIQAADEARHIEVFTKRALLLRKDLGLSTAGGQASLKTLLEEPDFALAFFLLSVLGEGSFLSLLWFLHENAPDPVTRQVARLRTGRARHVVRPGPPPPPSRRRPALRPRLPPRWSADDALQDTAGLNEEVFDALVVLAAGSWNPRHRNVRARGETPARHGSGARQRLQKLGFEEEAEALSALHTRNFM